jgi:hypothetical protein
MVMVAVECWAECWLMHQIHNYVSLWPKLLAASGVMLMMERFCVTVLVGYGELSWGVCMSGRVM